MPEINQYGFGHREVAKALVREAGLHEGKWQLTVRFTLGAGNVDTGPPNGVLPSAVVGVISFGLERATEQSPPMLVVDAAVVNPRGTLQ